MSKERLGGFSAAFDEMLEKNRRELEALGPASTLRRSRAGPDSPTLSAPAPPRASSQAPPAGNRGPAQPPQPRSAAQRDLDAKLGENWQQQVLERFRDGDDIIVRCQVSYAKGQISRTHYGAARIGDGPSVSGSSGGVHFVLG